MSSHTDKDEFDFDDMKSVLSIMQRINDDPANVTDEEITEAFGANVSPDEIRESIGKVTFKRTPKDVRASARGKYHRRVRNLKFALSEVERAIDDLLSAPGKTYKRDSIDHLRAAIEEFREVTGLRGDGSEELRQGEIDLTALFESGETA